MKISDLIFRMAGGLFFSIIYLAISYLALNLCVSWKWEKWGIGETWFVIGFVTYSILFEQEVNTTVNVIGLISIIGLIVCYNDFVAQSQLWFYIVVNSIVCLNIIITCIRK